MKLCNKKPKIIIQFYKIVKKEFRIPKLMIVTQFIQIMLANYQ